ncbi:MAG: hypothetical protein ACLPVY_17230 [Acidimicrobiia bacterium]
MELHDALTDLADTVIDHPRRLADVRARDRRHRRTRVAVTAASTAGVVGAALVVGALAFSPSSSRGPQANLAAGVVWADVTTSRGVQAALGRKLAERTCGGVPVPAGGLPQRPVHVDGPPPGPLSPPVWTGTPPPVGVPFNLSGTVTATTNDSLTITAAVGTSAGSFDMPSVCNPPLAVVGAEARIAGTRTGPDTYDFNTISVRIDLSQPEPTTSTEAQ